MKKRFFNCIMLTMLMILLSALPAYADVYEFGGGNSVDGVVINGNVKQPNPFTPRGYVIETDNGRFWLNSRFDNSDGFVYYSGIENGVDFIDAKKLDDSNYTMYAFTDRNPKVYQHLIAFKNGKQIEDFSQYVQAPGRLAEDEKLGSGANWAIPIIGFTFEPGCYYEFGFNRGMQANNGISLVFSEDGKGYLKTPFTPEEQAKYDAEKDTEYLFVSSFWINWNDDHSEYSYDFHLVPMRFSIQTYADTSKWTQGRQAAADFLKSVTPADYESGKYAEKNVNSLAAKLAELDEEINSSIRKMLQKDANTNITLMLTELEIAYVKAQLPYEEGADMEELNRYIKEGKYLYEVASQKIGTDLGHYGEKQVTGLKASLDAALLLTKENTQEEVDAAAKALSEDITRVYASVTHEPSLILSDYATGIKAIVPAVAVPADTVLFVQSIQEGSYGYSKIYEDLSPKLKENEELLIYKLMFYSGDIEKHPLKKYSVQIPLPDGTGANTLYYTPDADNAYRLHGSQADNVKIATVKDTGYFAIVYSLDEDYAPPDIPPDHENIVDETDVDIKDDPDKNLEDITQEQGKTETQENIGYDESRTDTTPLSPDIYNNADFSELENDAEYDSILIIAALLLAAAIITSICIIFRKRQ